MDWGRSLDLGLLSLQSIFQRIHLFFNPVCGFLQFLFDGDQFGFLFAELALVFLFSLVARIVRQGEMS